MTKGTAVRSALTAADKDNLARLVRRGAAAALRANPEQHGPAVVAYAATYAAERYYGLNMAGHYVGLVRNLAAEVLR